jgi:hypothetical protein
MTVVENARALQVGQYDYVVSRGDGIDSAAAS